jgi:hypothetical protein
MTRGVLHRPVELAPFLRAWSFGAIILAKAAKVAKADITLIPHPFALLRDNT